MASRSRLKASAAKWLSLPALERALRLDRAAGKRVVFTNGCFDLLHPGHIVTLERARSLGDVLVVGINSDRSVRTLQKSPGRPIVRQADRARVLSGLESVSYVVIFGEPTPIRLIRRIVPDVLVKGADWSSAAIVGSEVVKRSGGRVVRIPLVKGRSTTSLIERIKSGKSALD